MPKQIIKTAMPKGKPFPGAAGGKGKEFATTPSRPSKFPASTAKPGRTGKTKGRF